MKSLIYHRKQSGQCWRIRAIFACAILCFSSGLLADTSSVTLVNVTPTSFGVLWKGPAGGTPLIQLYADPAGKTNLSGQLGVNAFPLRTGSTYVAGTPAQRSALSALRQATAERGLMELEVTRCQPSTTYYFVVSAKDTNGVVVANPSIQSVTTADESSFIPAAEQLLLTLTGTNNLGSIVTLTHPNAAYALAGVVGDGAGTNQVLFTLSDLFNLTGGSFAPVGTEDFAADITENPGTQLNHFTASFTADFGVAATVSDGLATELVSLTIGSTVIRTGDTGSVPIGFVSKIGLASAALTIRLPQGKLTNFVLQALSPEVDPVATTLVTSGSTNAQLQIVTKSGQSLSGTGQILSLAFTAISNQPSAFVPLTLASASAIRVDGLTAAQIDAESGRVVVVGPRPLLEPVLLGDQSRQLTLYGLSPANYTIQSNTNLANTNGWKTFAQFPLTNGLSKTIGGLSPTFLHDFFRASSP